MKMTVPVTGCLAVVIAFALGGVDSSVASPPSAAGPVHATAHGDSRVFFLDCACEECAPLEGLAPGRYWLVSRPILRGTPDDFERYVRLFRRELSARFRDAEALSRTVVLRHRPDVAAARRTRRAIMERRSRQGYRVLEIEFSPQTRRGTRP